MKRIDVTLFIKENGTIEIHHEGTQQYTSFRNSSLRSFLIEQEMDVLKKLCVEEKEND